MSLIVTSIKKLTEYKNVSVQDIKDEPCSVCIDELKQIGSCVIKCLKCNNQFHKKCWKKAIRADPKCPKCRHNFRKSIVPKITQQLHFSPALGPQPYNGSISVIILNSYLAGYLDSKTILIIYNIPGGTQDKRHPNPGGHYIGDVRRSYLPFNNEGLQIYERFQRAFMFGHMFTVGSSLTRNVDNVIIWNGIHQKTNPIANTAHGFPDPAYFHNVDLELRTKGF